MRCSPAKHTDTAKKEPLKAAHQSRALAPSVEILRETWRATTIAEAELHVWVRCYGQAAGRTIHTTLCRRPECVTAAKVPAEAQRVAAPSAAESLGLSATIPGERRFAPRGASTGSECAGRPTINGSAGCEPLRLFPRLPSGIVLLRMGSCRTRFVLVNGRTAGPKTYRLFCCEPIHAGHLREISTRLPFCDNDCYVRSDSRISKIGHPKPSTFAEDYR